jgi:hypothetical protein
LIAEVSPVFFPQLLAKFSAFRRRHVSPLFPQRLPPFDSGQELI